MSNSFAIGVTFTWVGAECKLIKVSNMVHTLSQLELTSGCTLSGRLLDGIKTDAVQPCQGSELQTALQLNLLEWGQLDFLEPTRCTFTIAKTKS